MKNKSYRYNINRPRARHGQNYTKYKKCITIIMVICIKQHLSKNWSSVHEKVKHHWGWAEKKALLIKKLADDGRLLKQSRLVKFRDFSVARVTNINHHIIPILQKIYILYSNIGTTVYGAQRPFQNPVKQLRWSALRK